MIQRIAHEEQAARRLAKRDYRDYSAAMDTYYFELRALHIGAALASGTLFLLRALALNLADAAWPMTRPARILAYAVDTMLLAAAIALAIAIRQYPFVDGWLTMKVLLLGLYIVLGYRALRGPTLRARLLSLLGASATFLFIISVARAHDPLGLFAGQ